MVKTRTSLRDTRDTLDPFCIKSLRESDIEKFRQNALELSLLSLTSPPVPPAGPAGRSLLDASWTRIALFVELKLFVLRGMHGKNDAGRKLGQVRDVQNDDKITFRSSRKQAQFGESLLEAIGLQALTRAHPTHSRLLHSLAVQP